MMLFRFSAAQRIALCPGSVRASDGLPNTGGPDAERGTRIHAALAAHYVEPALAEYGLTDPDEIETYNTLIAMTDRFIAGLGSPISMGPICEREVEFGAWTGHPDYVAQLEDGTLVVPDWKTGHGEVPDPDENAQLRGYAVASCIVANLEGWRDWTRIMVAIIQPFEKTVPCEYTIQDEVMAEQDLKIWMLRAQRENAPRIPSVTACKYCPANNTSRCPETCAMVPAVIDSSDITTMDGDSLAALFEKWQIIEPMGKKLKAEIKKRLAANDSVGDLGLGNPKKLKSIPDVKGAYLALIESGVDEDLAFAMLKIELGKVEDALGDAKAYEILQPFIKLRESERPIVRMKAWANPAPLARTTEGPTK